MDCYRPEKYRIQVKVEPLSKVLVQLRTTISSVACLPSTSVNQFDGTKSARALEHRLLSATPTPENLAEHEEISCPDHSNNGCEAEREFWQRHDVWPETTPQETGLHIEYAGPSPSDINSAACTECGANVWATRRGPFVAEYDTGVICGYCSYDCYFSHRQRNNLEEIAGE